MDTETFLFLNGIGWTAISSISTLLAVIVALFLPYIQDNKKKQNILIIAKMQLLENLQLLKKADRKNSRLNPPAF